MNYNLRITVNYGNQTDNSKTLLRGAHDTPAVAPTARGLFVGEEWCWNDEVQEDTVAHSLSVHERKEPHSQFCGPTAPVKG